MNTVLSLPATGCLSSLPPYPLTPSLHTPPDLYSTGVTSPSPLSDLYHTRVFPSNMFDQLKDDFDSTFIVLVLAGLIAASAITRRLSQRRALQLAWK